MKPNALITGASSGIGLELAKLFAAEGFGLALVARDEARLRKVAEELRARNNVTVQIVSKDLSRPGAAQEVFAALKDFPVSILVNNAGSGVYGLFEETSHEEEIR